MCHTGRKQSEICMCFDFPTQSPLSCLIQIASAVCFYEQHCAICRPILALNMTFLRGALVYVCAVYIYIRTIEFRPRFFYWAHHGQENNTGLKLLVFN